MKNLILHSKTEKYFSRKLCSICNAVEHFELGRFPILNQFISKLCNVTAFENTSLIQDAAELTLVMAIDVKEYMSLGLVV